MTEHQKADYPLTEFKKLYILQKEFNLVANYHVNVLKFLDKEGGFHE